MADAGVQAQTGGGDAKPAGPSDTDKALGAKRVRTRIVVHLAGDDKTGRHVRYTLDDEENTIGHRADGAMFSTSADLLVTYPRMNPLRVQATGNVSETDDPTHAAIAQLIAAISGVPGLVNPDLAKAAASAAAPRMRGDADPAAFVLPKCEELVQAERALADIQIGLFGPTVSAANLADQFAAWVKAFDDQIGPAGATKAAVETAGRVNGFYENVHALADTAAAAIKLAQTRANAAPQPTAAQQRYNEALAELITGQSVRDDARL